MDKVIRFSHQFENEELRESIVKVIEGLQDIPYKEISSHVVINQLFSYFELFICYREL